MNPFQSRKSDSRKKLPHFQLDKPAQCAYSAVHGCDASAAPPGIRGLEIAMQISVSKLTSMAIEAVANGRSDLAVNAVKCLGDKRHDVDYELTQGDLDSVANYLYAAQDQDYAEALSNATRHGFDSVCPDPFVNATYGDILDGVTRDCETAVNVIKKIAEWSGLETPAVFRESTWRDVQ